MGRIRFVLMSLLITNQVVLDPHDTVIEPAGWRVAVDSETEADTWLALPLHFGGERDAERAKAALAKASDSHIANLSTQARLAI
jgi:hypothetical protein